MKKSLILSAALFAALGANAEVFNYDFNQNPNFFKLLQLPESEDGLGWTGNYDLIYKDGTTKNTDGEAMIYKPEGAEKGIARANRLISLYDGQTYLFTEEANSYDYPVADETILSHPFLSWGEKGVTRVLWMPGWGSEDAWADANYNAASEADWVSSKHGIQFSRIGTLGMVSRSDTWIQFPAVEAPAKVTVWAGALYDKNNTQNLQVRVTPVVDGVVGENVKIFDKPVVENDPTSEQVKNKRYYKMEYTFNGTGKVAFRVGPENNQLYLMHVRIENNGESGIEDVIATPVEDENAPIYNVLGIQVDENYKGIVIKNGKKYIQK